MRETRSPRIGLENAVLGSMRRERLLVGVFDWFVPPRVRALRSEDDDAPFPRP